MIRKVKDEYLVYRNPRNNADYYYKNKQLHREDGPAIVVEDEKDLYSNLSDKNLYKRVNEQVVEEVFEVYSECNYNGDITTGKRYFNPKSSCYYLNAIEYSKEELYAFILEKELNKEINNKKQIKKLKL